MSRLLFLNAGVGSNLGDRAMLVNVLRLARTHSTKAKLTISIDAPMWMAKEFGADRVPLLIHIWGRWSLLARRLHLPKMLATLFAPLYYVFSTFSCALLLLGPASLRQRMAGMEGEFVRSLASTDCVWFSGGGYLTDDGKLEARSLLLTALLARIRGARVVMTGQGVGPFNSLLTRILLRRVLLSSESAFFRDHVSTEWVQHELEARAIRLQTGVDDACSLPRAAVPELLGRALLAINCRISQFHANSENTAGILLQVIHAHLVKGYDIRLFVFHERLSAEHELYVRWMKELPTERVEVVMTSDPRQLYARLARCDRAVGVAYHFTLFALLAGVPTLAIYSGRYYEQKFSGLATKFSCPQLMLEQTELTSDAVLRLLEATSESSSRESRLRHAAGLARACDRQIQITLGGIGLRN